MFHSFPPGNKISYPLQWIRTNLSQMDLNPNLHPWTDGIFFHQTPWSLWPRVSLVDLWILWEFCLDLEGVGNDLIWIEWYIWYGLKWFKPPTSSLDWDFVRMLRLIWLIWILSGLGMVCINETFEDWLPRMLNFRSYVQADKISAARCQCNECKRS